MAIADIGENETRLAGLVPLAMEGDEILLGRGGRPMVRLVPIPTDTSPRVGGQWHGRVRIAEDFGVLPADIAAAFGIDPT